MPWEEVDFGDNLFGVYKAMVGDAMHFTELEKVTCIAEALLPSTLH
jgi:hypothetical protein